MVIPVGLLYALVPVLATAALGFLVWLVRELGQHAASLARVAEQRDDHEHRLARLEAWYDGFHTGQRLERMSSSSEPSS